MGSCLYSLYPADPLYFPYAIEHWHPRKRVSTRYALYVLCTLYIFPHKTYLVRFLGQSDAKAVELRDMDRPFPHVDATRRTNNTPSSDWFSAFGFDWPKVHLSVKYVQISWYVVYAVVISG